MGLKVNNIDVTSINFNGTAINELQLNGTSIWEKQVSSIWYAPNSSGQYLYLNNPVDFHSADTWEIKTQFKYTHSTDGRICGQNKLNSSGIQGAYPIISVISGYLYLGLSSNGIYNNRYDLCQLGPSSTQLTIGNVYDIRLSFTGTQYLLECKEKSASNWDTIFTVNSQTKIYSDNSLMEFCNQGNDGHVQPLGGQLNITSTTIKLDNSIIFDGATAVEGTDYTNVGCTVIRRQKPTGNYITLQKRNDVSISYDSQWGQTASNFAMDNYLYTNDFSIAATEDFEATLVVSMPTILDTNPVFSDAFTQSLYLTQRSQVRHYLLNGDGGSAPIFAVRIVDGESSDHSIQGSYGTLVSNTMYKYVFSRVSKTYNFSVTNMSTDPETIVFSGTYTSPSTTLPIQGFSLGSHGFYSNEYLRGSIYLNHCQIKVGDTVYTFYVDD